MLLLRRIVCECDEGLPIYSSYFSFLHVRQIIGILAYLERFQADAEERGNAFVLTFLEKQRTRLKALFDRHIVRASFLPPVGDRG